jgi:hypothetical protein
MLVGMKLSHVVSKIEIEDSSIPATITGDIPYDRFRVAVIPADQVVEDTTRCSTEPLQASYKCGIKPLESNTVSIWGRDFYI